MGVIMVPGGLTVWKTLEAFAAEDVHSPQESCSLTTTATAEDAIVFPGTDRRSLLCKENWQLLPLWEPTAMPTAKGTAFGEGDAAKPALSQKELLLSHSGTLAESSLWHSKHPQPEAMTDLYAPGFQIAALRPLCTRPRP